MLSSSRRRSAVVALAMMGAMMLPARPAPAAPLAEWVVTGPTGSLSATVSLDDGDGTLRLGAARNGRIVLAAAAVGLRTTDADLSLGLRLVGTVQRTITDQYSMTTGKRRNRASQMSELTLSLQEASGKRIDLMVRVGADGVAYRYVLPTAATVTGEASAFTVPATAPAWLLPYNAWYEQNRVQTTAGGAAAGDFGYPSLFGVGPDFVLLTESDVDGRYPGSRLRHVAGSPSYQVVLADATVSATAGLRTPWRTAIIGDLAGVTESTLVDDLAAPARFQDTSWIKPGKVAWSWLSEHDSPRDPQRQRQYVDFAARNGWPYVLVDEGWSATWVPDLVRYARARGVDILLWFHWTDLDTPQERDTVLPRVRQWGVRGVKLDFMNSDSRARNQWYDAVLAKTAEQRLMVNFHGSTIPHGLARTWPHIMTMEGVRGAENFPPARNNPVQAFTRGVVGSMDYTPVSLEVGTHEASVAHEVALPVAYESGWTHSADKPEAYGRFPQALRFLNQVPTVWDETRLVGGAPGDSAILARRNGDRWFVGAIATGSARTLTAPLRFLGAGDWLVEVVRDPQPGQRLDLRRDRQVLRSTSTLSVVVPANGGFAAIICPNFVGRQTCDQPIRPVPASTVMVSPQIVDVAPGSTFAVAASFTLKERTISDVSLIAAAPPGWTVSGLAVRRTSMMAGETITGSWTVRVGEQSPIGFVDVPVYAEFRAPDSPQQTEPVHVEQAMRTFVPPPAPSGAAFVSDLPFITESNGWGPVERDLSNGEQSGGDGRPLAIGGIAYTRGIGAHASSEVSIYLGRNCRSFSAALGVDDETTQPGSVTFQVFGDDILLYDSGILRSGTPATLSTVDIRGVRMLSLRVTDGGDGRNFDHADWADPRLSCG